MRVLTLLGLASCVYWVMTHPGEWEKLQQDEAQFRADLYSGKFLSDAATEWENHISKVKNKDDKYRHSFEEFESTCGDLIFPSGVTVKRMSTVPMFSRPICEFT